MMSQQLKLAEAEYKPIELLNDCPRLISALLFFRFYTKLRAQAFHHCKNKMLIEKYDKYFELNIFHA